MTKVWWARACLCHMAPQLPIGKFTCSSHRSTWRGQHSHTFLHQITKTNYLQMSKNVLESMDSSLTQIINFKKKRVAPLKHSHVPHLQLCLVVLLVSPPRSGTTLKQTLLYTVQGCESTPAWSDSRTHAGFCWLFLGDSRWK